MGKEKKTVDTVVEEEKVEKPVQSAEEQMEDLKGVDGEGVVIKSKRGKEYTILPCSIASLPKLFKLMEEWQKKGATTITEESVKIMGRIIIFALKEKHSEFAKMKPEQAADLFAISDFPKILTTVMDLNDFFSGMRDIVAKQKIVAMAG